MVSWAWCWCSGGSCIGVGGGDWRSSGSPSGDCARATLDCVELPWVELSGIGGVGVGVTTRGCVHHQYSLDCVVVFVVVEISILSNSWGSSAVAVGGTGRVCVHAS